MERRKRYSLYVEAITSIIAFLIIVLLSFSGVGVTYAAETAYADDGKLIPELERITIDGKKFATADYPADSEGTPTVLYLNEIGYDGGNDTRGLYALTLYVYNPSQINVVDDVRNQIQMKIGNEERYAKYDLKLEDKSADNLFSKFAVAFKNGEKQAALKALDKDERVYELSSIELYVSSFNATDFPLTPTEKTIVYKCTGFAAGLGENDTTESTLNYTKVGGSETIPLSVKHTSWRPEGTNGNSSWTQDTIHSVYFAVPKKYGTQYDYLNSVTAEWYRARLEPFFVTDNIEVSNNLRDLIEYQMLIGGYDELGVQAPTEFDLSVMGDYVLACGFLNDFAGHYEYVFCNDKVFNKYFNIKGQKRLRGLFLVFCPEQTIDGRLITTSSELEQAVQLEAMGIHFKNDNKVANKYPSWLFESWDMQKHKETIIKGEKDKELNLHSENVRVSLWERLFGGSHLENQHDYENLEAIRTVSEEDIIGSDAEISNRLYISERDVEDFKTFFQNNNAKSEIYILRYATSEDLIIPATVGEFKNSSSQLLSTNSYLAQEDCFFDFDIIDFEYKKNGKSYVIPVSMSPVDIFPEPPSIPVYEENDLWKYGLAIIGGLVVLGIAYGIISRQIKKSRGD